MDIHSILIVSKYLMSESDYINLIKVSRKYKDLLMFFRYNPISDTTLFPMIQTQHFYKREDIINKISDMVHYIHWYEVDQNEWMKRSHLDVYKQVTLYNHGVSWWSYHPFGEINTIDDNDNSDNNNENNSTDEDEDEDNVWSCPLPIVKGICTVPEGITSLGPCCFMGCTGITKIELPSTLRGIYSYAFKATSIREIKIPEGVTSIGESCFSECFNINKIVFPHTLMVIGRYCVHFCSTIPKVKIPRDCIVNEEGLHDVDEVEYY